MIRSVSCNQPSFRTVEFKSGFNVILADTTQNSSDKDSRNGVGKSLLVEIIHFCLGSDGTGLKAEAIKDWTFTLTIEIEGKVIRISRNTSKSNIIILDGDFSGWANRPTFNRNTGSWEMHPNDWTSQLGAILFGLAVGVEKQTYAPKFRNLISYFIRRGRDAFASPFFNHRSTKEGEKQIYHTFLLGLNWNYARQFQMLKDRKGTLDTLKRAAKEGLMVGFLGTVGELQSEKIRLQDESSQTKANLEAFQVHPQYQAIEHRANSLTREIHDMSNQNIVERGILTLYESSMREEVAPESRNVEAMYKEIGIVLPSLVRKRLEEVEAFHLQLTENRRQFLATEISRLHQSIEDRNSEMLAKNAQRAELMVVLRTHGALEEYTRLQQFHLEIIQQINDIEMRITNLRSFEEGVNTLKIEQANLVQNARRDLDERTSILSVAIRLFIANSEALYNVPGNLAVDIKETGYDFKVDIKRDGSEGIDSMKIFCYDLMLAQIWSEKPISPHLLIHDSTLFDGVDERQKAHALRLAADEAKSRNFQYICLLNSDSLPSPELLEGFDIANYVRVTLTDQEEGCLLGIRY